MCRTIVTDIILLNKNRKAPDGFSLVGYVYMKYIFAGRIFTVYFVIISLIGCTVVYEAESVRDIYAMNMNRFIFFSLSFSCNIYTKPNKYP